MFTQTFWNEFFKWPSRYPTVTPKVEPVVSATTDGRVILDFGSGFVKVRFSTVNAKILINKLTKATEMAESASKGQK